MKACKLCSANPTMLRRRGMHIKDIHKSNHNLFLQEYNIISINIFVLFLRNVTNDTVQALTYISLDDWCA